MGGVGGNPAAPAGLSLPAKGCPPPGGGREMLAPFGSPLGMGHDLVIWLAKRPGGKRKMPRTEDVLKLKMCLDFEGKGRKLNRFWFLLYIFVPTPHGQQQLKTLRRKVFPLQTGLASCNTPQQPHGPPCTPAPQDAWSQPCNFGGPIGAASHSRAL